MIYDLIIIGAGPAGLSAAIYATRYKLNFLLIGKINDSAIAKSHKIENYPGTFSISGQELVQNWRQQVLDLGAKCINENVISVKKEDVFNIELGDGHKYQSHNIILAMGTVKKKLGVPGEEKFEGSGVSYCATCDAPFFRGKKVAVVGGNDAAAKTTLHLTDFAEKVYLIYRRDKLRTEPIWVEKITNNPKIEVIYNTNIMEIFGKGIVTGVKLDSGDTVFLNGVFVEIGSAPNSNLAKSLGVETDVQGYIKISSSGATNIEGIYAAGDLTTGSNKFRQIITAAAEGAIASASVYGEVKKY